MRLVVNALAGLTAATLLSLLITGSAVAGETRADAKCPQSDLCYVEETLESPALAPPLCSDEESKIPTIKDLSDEEKEHALELFLQDKQAAADATLAADMQKVAINQGLLLLDFATAFYHVFNVMPAKWSELEMIPPYPLISPLTHLKLRGTGDGADLTYGSAKVGDNYKLKLELQLPGGKVTLRRDVRISDQEKEAAKKPAASAQAALAANAAADAKPLPKDSTVTTTVQLPVGGSMLFDLTTTIGANGKGTTVVSAPTALAAAPIARETSVVQSVVAPPPAAAADPNAPGEFFKDGVWDASPWGIVDPAALGLLAPTGRDHKSLAVMLQCAASMGLRHFEEIYGGPPKDQAALAERGLHALMGREQAEGDWTSRAPYIRVVPKGTSCLNALDICLACPKQH